MIRTLEKTYRKFTLKDLNSFEAAFIVFLSNVCLLFSCDKELKQYIAVRMAIFKKV